MNTSVLLDVLAFGAVLSGVFVITAKNPVISVVFLISVFINVAGYLVLIGVAYLGLVYIIVYVGAIAILFLFVIMMLNLRLVELDDTGKAYTQNIPAGSIIGALFFFEALSITSSFIGDSSYKDAGVSTLPTILYDKIADLLTFFSSALSPLKGGGPFSFLFGQSAKGEDQITYNEHASNYGDMVHIAFNPSAADLSFISIGQIQSIGIGLYTHATLWLVITSLILLLSMVGPIVLCINPSSR